MVATTEDRIREARTLCEAGAWSQVLTFAQKWRAEEPLDPKALFYTGLGFSGIGQYAQAETAYRQALKLDATDTKVWNNLGGILFEHLKRPHEGINCLENSLKLNPNNRLGWANLSAMVGRLGLHDQAIQYANRALALDPDLIEAYLYKAAAARSLGRTEIVRQVCETLATFGPEKFRRAR